MPSVKTNFSLKDEDIEKVKQAIIRAGNTSEEVINDYLHNVAGGKIAKSITNYIPLSPREDVIHAQTSKWYEQDDFNLAVGIGNSLKGKRGTSFYYLYYVVIGKGPNKKKGPRDFMKDGLNEEYDSVVDGLMNELEKNIEKEMNL